MKACWGLIVGSREDGSSLLVPLCMQNKSVRSETILQAFIEDPALRLAVDTNSYIILCLFTCRVHALVYTRVRTCNGHPNQV